MPNLGLAETQDVTFGWRPNQESNLGGYEVCCGIQSRSIADYDFCEDVGNPPLTGGKVEYVLSGLTENQAYFCSVRAYADTTEEKSSFCNEINFIAEPAENTWSAVPPEEFPTWHVDYNNDGFVDTLYVNNQGMWLSLGSYAVIPPEPILLSAQFANWDPTKDVIYIKKFDKDQWYDIVGFGYSGVYVSWGINGTSTSAISCILHDFGYQQGWRIGHHKRELVDINSDNLPDIIGMGELGIKAAHNNGDRTVSLADDNGYIIHDFGYNHGSGWLIPYHIRRFVDIDEDGAIDFVGIGNTKIFVCWGLKDANGFPTGKFSPKETLFSGNFCNYHGWKKKEHIRIFRNMDGQPGKEFVGFGDSGVVILKNIGGRSLQGWSYVTPYFGWLDGWGRNNIRVVKDVNSDGRKDFSGWKNGTHYVVLQQADGSYGPLLEWHE